MPMSYCRVWASLPSDPNDPCLVFLISLENSNTIVDEVKFYGPHGGHQMFLPIDFLVD